MQRDEPKHKRAMIAMRLGVALSTKLDYDELRNVTRVAKDGTYGTVSSGNAELMFRRAQLASPIGAVR